VIHLLTTLLRSTTGSYPATGTSTIEKTDGTSTNGKLAKIGTLTKHHRTVPLELQAMTVDTILTAQRTKTGRYRNVH